MQIILKLKYIYQIVVRTKNYVVTKKQFVFFSMYAYQTILRSDKRVDMKYKNIQHYHLLFINQGANKWITKSFLATET